MSLADYRLYFLDAKGAIQAREEFSAPSDADANFISNAVADACSGSHAGYEVWSFARRVVTGTETKPVPSWSDISRNRQERILELEDSIQRSRWRIAQSERLTEKATELRALLGPQSASLKLKET